MGAAALRRARWRHPEAGGAALAAAAWAVLAAGALGGGTLAALHADAHRAAPALAGAAGWVLMVAAMMVPTALPAARRLALGALWRRRRRTVWLFLGAYLATWTAFGALVLPALALATGGSPAPPVVVAGALAAAAAWELAPVKWRLVRACHLLAPVPPSGRRADAGCLAGGLRHGALCVAACWPVMVAMAAAGHERLGLMALLAAVVVAERGALRPSPLARPAAAALAAAAALTATL